MPPARHAPDPRIEALPAAEIRRRFVAFFAERGHEVVPSASLVPAGDQTLLFTNCGMVQFKEVFTGAETRSYTRAVDYQRCLRVAGKHNDFEEVGRSPRHHTFFEMLGNWSFGDYFKREAIHWAWDVPDRRLLGIPAERLAATTYKDDEVARAIWRDEIGLPPERMAALGRRRRRRRQELLADGRHRSVRAVQRDPLRPRRAAVRGTRVRPRPLRALPALGRALEPRVHGVRPASRTAGCRCRSRASTRAWASSASRRCSSRSRATTTPTCSRRSTPGCASSSGTIPTRSRRSASATRSSPTTPGRSPS